MCNQCQKYSERVAIIEYCGGLSRADAERAARNAGLALCGKCKEEVNKCKR